MKTFYRWPCGMFEHIGPPFYVYRYRPEPCTPAGDELCRAENMEQADAIAQYMNDGLSLSEAKVKAGCPA